MKVRALQNDTVDQLCWRHYGKTAGVTEKVLEANPGLSNQIFLNAGQEIEMPVITSEVERVSAPPAWLTGAMILKPGACWA
ncbi:TPA: tail protein X [Klebsiella pneumoniae]|nr:tail protein X [Klebsiella pneumoniae]HCC2887920.1 tail protein X [Klebsiella variicola]HDK6406036.1 tail protein X [Klebsiella variicola]